MTTTSEYSAMFPVDSFYEREKRNGDGVVPSEFANPIDQS